MSLREASSVHEVYREANKSDVKSRLANYLLLYHTQYVDLPTSCCVFYTCVGVSNGQHEVSQSKGKRTATGIVLLWLSVRSQVIVQMHLLCACHSQ